MLKKIIFICITALSFISVRLHAYEFSFFNTTSIPIAIAIQFAGSENEPLYKLYIKPNTMKSFVPGSIDIPDIKWSFCLKHIYYIKNPTMAQRAHNFAIVTNWRKVAINWIDKALNTTPHRKISHKHPKLILMKKKTGPVYDTSLCKDRHFEIVEDQGTIAIIASKIE